MRTLLAQRAEMIAAPDQSHQQGEMLARWAADDLQDDVSGIAAQFAAVIRALDCPVRLIVGEADAEAAAAVEACLGHALPRLAHTALSVDLTTWVFEQQH